VEEEDKGGLQWGGFVEKVGGTANAGRDRKKIPIPKEDAKGSKCEERTTCRQALDEAGGETPKGSWKTAYSILLRKSIASHIVTGTDILRRLVEGNIKKKRGQTEIRKQEERNSMGLKGHQKEETERSDRGGGVGGNRTICRMHTLVLWVYAKGTDTFEGRP